MQNKSQIRQEFRKKRSQLSREEVVKKSKKINENFLKNLLPKLNQNKIFSLYHAVENEVQTLDIAEYFSANKIKFSYPKIIEKNFPLEFILHEKNQKIISNKFFPSLVEPESGAKVFPDILIMPLVAFDKNMSRIGMGGGFFDRTIAFLKSQNYQIVTVGLAYDLQCLDDNFQNEKHDWSLDFIVSESSIYSAN